MGTVVRAGSLLLVLALAAAGASAQSDDSIPTEGFWPTRLMLERILDRVSEDVADHYNLDDDQLGHLREVFRERIPRFMSENRREIQTLMNQFFEAQLSLTPPDSAEVAEWAQRVLPLIEKGKAEVEALAEDMKSFMNDVQGTKLSNEMAAFRLGVGMASQKVVQWAEGGFDPDTEWTPGRQERRQRREAREMARAEQRSRSSAEPTSTAGPADEWTRYVEDFARRYEFTTDQRAQADRLLAQRKQARDDYLRRRAEELAAAQARLEAASQPEEKEAVARDIERLGEPVERMFAELKQALDRIPTREQRRKVEAAAAPPPPADPAPAEKPGR
jgi:hypothetical protein